MLRKNNGKLDIEKMNEGIHLGVRVLWILLFMLFISAIYLFTLLLAKWRILPFLFDILKVFLLYLLGLLLLGFWILW